MTTDTLEIAQWVLRFVLAGAFVTMGILHFRPGPRRVMARMIPPALRFADPLSPATLVAVTGVLEIAGGIGLLITATQTAAGICLALFLVAVFPANAYAAAHPETFGRLAVPLLSRLIAQLVLIVLCLLAAVPL